MNAKNNGFQWVSKKTIITIMNININWRRLTINEGPTCRTRGSRRWRTTITIHHWCDFMFRQWIAGASCLLEELVEIRHTHRFDVIGRHVLQRCPLFVYFGWTDKQTINKMVQNCKNRVNTKWVKFWSILKLFKLLTKFRSKLIWVENIVLIIDNMIWEIFEQWITHRVSNIEWARQ